MMLSYNLLTSFTHHNLLIQVSLGIFDIKVFLN